MREQRRQCEDNVPVSVETDAVNRLGKSKHICQGFDLEDAINTEIN
jgi:hypothetical protein